MVAAVGRSLGKARKDGEEEQAGDLLSLPQIHRACWDSHSGKNTVFLSKTKMKWVRARSQRNDGSQWEPE